jgi:hypothetical protein
MRYNQWLFGGKGAVMKGALHLRPKEFFIVIGLIIATG